MRLHTLIIHFHLLQIILNNIILFIIALQHIHHHLKVLRQIQTHVPLKPLSNRLANLHNRTVQHHPIALVLLSLFQLCQGGQHPALLLPYKQPLLLIQLC